MEETAAAPVNLPSRGYALVRLSRNERATGRTRDQWVAETGSLGETPQMCQSPHLSGSVRTGLRRALSMLRETSSPYTRPISIPTSTKSWVVWNRSTLLRRLGE